MRRLSKIITSLVLCLIMCLSALTGCALITTNSQRDMNQVVATVKIDTQAPLDKIYKKDIVTSYLNYGYVYEQYYGYTTEQAILEIIDTLVNNRIYVQNAIKQLQLSADGVKDNTVTDVWDVKRYLTTEEQTDAEYNTLKNVNDFIESLISKGDEDTVKKDSLWEEVRTSPTNATNKTQELGHGDKSTYVEEGVLGYDKEEGNADNRNAYNKFVKILRANALLGKDFLGDVRTTDFYTQTLLNQYESKLIENYENKIKFEARGVTSTVATEKQAQLEAIMDNLISAYEERYEEQAEWSTTDFVTKLSEASVSEPILYGHGGHYGYVYNLLLGVSGTPLEAMISNLDSEVADIKDETLRKQTRLEKRETILSATTVKDLRSSWILSGYDFDGEKFTGDYTFAKDSANSLKFYGNVSLLKEATQTENAKYSVLDLQKLTLDGFITEMETYVYGAPKTVAGDNDASVSVYKAYQHTAKVEEYDAKINELLFAFSTDGGSLNTYKGYVVKPIPDGTDEEEYVQEFADGARRLMELGGYSYLICATDYGYHVMFFSEVFSVDYGYDNLVDYLNNEQDKSLNQQAWATELGTILSVIDDEKEMEKYQDNYLYLLYNSVYSTSINNALSNYKTETLNEYRYEEPGKFVKIYTERYKDLMK